MLPRSLAGRSLGRISTLKGKAPARSYFVQAQRSQLQQESTSFPRRCSSSYSSSSVLASIPPPGSPRPGQPPPAYPSKDKVLIILDHGELIALSGFQVVFFPLTFFCRAHRNSLPLPLRPDFFPQPDLSPALLSRALREFGLMYGRAISSTRMYCRQFNHSRFDLPSA